jgi:hypothetical protein
LGTCYLATEVPLLTANLGNLFTEPLPSKWTSASVRYYSGYQAVFTEPLPSKWSYSSYYLYMRLRQGLTTLSRFIYCRLWVHALLQDIYMVWCVVNSKVFAPFFVSLVRKVEVPILHPSNTSHHWANLLGRWTGECAERSIHSTGFHMKDCKHW